MGAQVQRVAAYAVIVRDGRILMSRLAPKVSKHELWTLPGGGLDHGEDPRDAVVREVYEETGLPVTVGHTAHTFSLHLPDTWRNGRRVDAHSLRIVYRGSVPHDSPEPRVMEVDGSTIEAAWLPLEQVLDGTVPTVALVQEALALYRPTPLQRIAAYALARRDDGAVLLTRISSRGHHAGSWTLPGGGVDHGEPPATSLRRELLEECGLGDDDVRLGGLLTVHDVHFRGNGPQGDDEDFHGVHLVYTASVSDRAQPRVVETDGTTDDVAWVTLDEIESGAVPVLEVVRAALEADVAG